MACSITRTLVLIIFVSFSGLTAAQNLPSTTLGSTTINYSGFISLSAGQHNRETYSYFGYDDDLSFENDTVIGFQLDASISNQLSFTTQVIARGFAQDDGDNFQPQFEWFYGSYKISPRWRLRLGRLGYPLYPLSDYQTIGYAYNWLRPPTTVYNTTSRTTQNTDGVDLLFNDKLGEYDVSIQFIYGQMDKKINSNPLTFNDMAGVNAAVAKDYWEFYYYLNVFYSDIEVDQIQPLLDLFSTATTPEVAAIPSLYTMDDVRYVRQTVGAKFDLDPLIIHAEYLLLDAEEVGVAADNKAWYISTAYQFESITPYLYVGGIKLDYNNSIAQGLASADTVANATFKSLLSLAAPAITPVEQRETVLAFGVRLDPWRQTSIKLEALHVDPDGTPGQLKTEGSLTTPGKPITIYSIRLDFIF